MTYIHDELCNSRIANGWCNCYVARLEEKDKRIADLTAERDQLAAERDRLVSQRTAAFEAEVKDASKAFEALSSAGYPTGYGRNSSWAISDLCRALAQMKAERDQLGADLVILHVQRAALTAERDRLISQQTAALEEHDRAVRQETAQKAARICGTYADAQPIGEAARVAYWLHDAIIREFGLEGK